MLLYPSLPLSVQVVIQLVGEEEGEGEGQEVAVDPKFRYKV